MAKAGHCAECGTAVWVNEDGTCQRGHPAASVSGVYETGTPGPSSAADTRKKNAAWIVVAVVAVLVPVVCLVTGILFAIAVPVFDSASGNAKMRACFANQRTIEGAVHVYLADKPDAAKSDLAGAVNALHPLVGEKLLSEPPACAVAPDEAYVLDDEGLTTCPAGDPPDGHGHYTD